MTDVTTKSILQSQIGLGVGAFSEAGPKNNSQQVGVSADGIEALPEAVEKARQMVGGADASGSESQLGSQNKKDQQAHYTIMIGKCSGESRAISVKAGSLEAAKGAARQALEEGEEVMSASESTVPAPPDPKRGLIA